MTRTVLDPTTPQTLATLDAMFQQLYYLRELISDPSYTAVTPAMSIKTAAQLFVSGVTSQRCIYADTNGTSSSDVPLTGWNRATTGDNVFAEFATETAFTARGSIRFNRAGGVVQYNTTSDYRVKTIYGPVADSGATVDALKPYVGRMHGATQTRPMFLAHELQGVAPYAVSGEKDAVHDDGSPQLQQVDVSTLVPLLVAELQALRARVAALEAA